MTAVAGADDRAMGPGADGAPILTLKDVHSYYGNIHALQGVTIEVGRGEIVTLIGANGAGKTTTLKTISGLLPARKGSVSFDGQDITRTPAHQLVKAGIGHAPEGRRIFSRLTVMENLQMGAFTRDLKTIGPDIERVLTLFPRLRERITQQGGTLSGGEQQMLAIARALMSRPRLLLLDEPSLGLAPLIRQQIFSIVRELNVSHGITVFLVEQNAFHALRLAHRGYVMVNGTITLTGTGAELLRRPEVQSAYLDGGRR